MDRVTEYARKTIADGTACKAVIQACNRHLCDLRRAGLPGSDLEWDAAEADKYIRFAEKLHYYDDAQKRSLPLRLKPFQAFIIGSVFGWKKGGIRRFTDLYIQIARKNGKSFLSAFFALAFSFVCPIRDGEIYCTGTEQKNALLAWREIKKFIEREPALRKRYKIMEYRSEILNLRNKTSIKAISGNTEIDGPKPYCAIIDEYHLHPTDAMYTVLRDGMINLPGALSIVITTAGFDLNRDCYRQYKFAKNVVAGAIKQDNLFVFIAEADLPDAHDAPEAYERALWDVEKWKQANPLFLDGSGVALQKMKDKADEARELGGTRLRDFIVKHLNCWRAVGSNPFVPAEAWARCGTDKKLSDFSGRECFVGLDLSSKNDLASYTILVPTGGKPYVYSHSFMPKARLAQHIRSDKAPYDVWAEKGLLTLTVSGGDNGYILDYDFILEHLKKTLADNRLTVRMLGYDPMGASGIISRLEEICSELVEIGQYPKSLNDTVRHCQGTILGGGVEYDSANELLTWSIVNAEVVTDSKKQMIIEKKLAEKRIDPIDALLDCWKCWLITRPDPETADDWFDIMSKL